MFVVLIFENSRLLFRNNIEKKVHILRKVHKRQLPKNSEKRHLAEFCTPFLAYFPTLLLFTAAAFCFLLLFEGETGDLLMLFFPSMTIADFFSDLLTK